MFRCSQWDSAYADLESAEQFVTDWRREDARLVLPQRTLRPVHWVLALAVVLAAFALAHGAELGRVWHDHHFEDRQFIDYDAQKIHSWSDCFTERGLWPGLYRPLSTNLYFHAGNAIFGKCVECYHAVNIVLILSCGVLLFRLAAFLLGTFWALVPAALFVSRQAHAELLVPAAEAQILLATVLALMGLCLFVAGRSTGRPALVWASLAPMLLAFLSKESIVLVPLGLLGFGLLYDSWRHARRYLPVVGLAALYSVLLMAVLRPLVAGMDTTFSYDTSAANVLRNITSFVLVFFNFLASPRDAMLFPTRVQTLRHSVPLQAVVIGLAALALFLLVVQRWARARQARDLRVIAFGLLLFFLTALPYLFFTDRMSMRYSFAPHLGLALASGGLARLIVSPLVQRLAHRWRTRTSLGKSL